MENKIKIAFKNVGLEQKAKFAESNCLLTISVGQETHEGELFNLTIDLINKSFKSCIILVDDSLQRYTMALNSDKSANYYYGLAVSESKNWLKRNKQYYNKLTIPYKILHWDQWLKHDSFKQQKKIIKESIKEDALYKAAFDKVIENFVNKSSRRSDGTRVFAVSRAKRLSMDYLIEECTALCLWTSLNCQFEVYPGPRNEAMSATHKKFVLDKYPDLLHSIAIRFRHAEQFKPQVFKGMGTANYLTKEKENLEILESIIAMMPGHVYWLDTNGVYLGCNDNQARSAGLKSRKDIVGLKNKDLPWNKGESHLVAELDKANWEVMSGNHLSLEEPGTLPDGKHATFLSYKTPLYNSNKEIIGLVGISVDITAQKESERLIVEEQEKFRKSVKKLIHDITSPVMSINNIAKRLSSNVPEEDRVTLRGAATRIDGVSQRLLSEYNNENVEDVSEDLVVSLALLQIINEKNAEYYESNVTIVAAIEGEDIIGDVNFTCIKHNAGIFKRMMSNLINNAVEAVKDKPEGKVTVTLTNISKGTLFISVADNGPGMPKHIIDKFEQGISITEGKENGHGVGLTQVKDAIATGNGRCEIYASKRGTEIKMWFPTVATPQWLCTEIQITKDDTVLILDDDDSIHGSWDKSFDDVLKKFPTIKIKHFTQGQEVITYINGLAQEQKQDIFLLTDFELLDQKVDGLDVVKQTNMKRAVLVTSYSSSLEQQKEVIRLGIKMLPKELVPDTKIKVDKRIPKWSNKVDMVWVEDQKWYVDGIVKKYYSHLKVDTYYDPVSFMEEIHQYPLETRIILDTYYDAEDGTPYMQTGYDLAKDLHNMGYTKLIIYTGEDPKGLVPEYLQVVRKKDPDSDANMDKI